MGESLFIEPLMRWFQKKMSRPAPQAVPAQGAQSADLTGISGAFDTESRSQNQVSVGLSDGPPFSPPYPNPVGMGDQSLNVGSKPIAQQIDGQELSARPSASDSTSYTSGPEQAPAQEDSLQGVRRVQLSAVDEEGSPTGAVSGEWPAPTIIPGADEEGDDVQLAPDPADNLSGSLRRAFTRKSLVSQETKDLLDRYGTVDIHQLTRELRQFASSIGMTR